MALFPIVGRFEGDFIPHLVAVDTDDNMDEVAEKVAVHSVGRRLPDREVHSFEVLRRGERIDPSVQLGELGLAPLDWLDVRWRE